jgi:hypothetical protein
MKSKAFFFKLQIFLNIKIVQLTLDHYRLGRPAGRHSRKRTEPCCHPDRICGKIEKKRREKEKLNLRHCKRTEPCCHPVRIFDKIKRRRNEGGKYTFYGANENFRENFQA